MKSADCGILERASILFASALSRDREAQAYLKGRGIDMAARERFSIGVSRHSERDLARELRCEIDDLLRLGLAAKSGAGRIYPLFRNRVTITIRDADGTTRGFAGRVLGGAGPKYVNTPETELFRKGERLFGEERIGEAKEVVLVEGYYDVVSMWSVASRTAVACMGTRLTEAQAATLIRAEKPITLMFDGDTAGRKATFDALGVLLREGLPMAKIRVALLPGGADPDTMLREPNSVHGKTREYAAKTYLEKYLEITRNRSRGLMPLIPLAETLQAWARETPGKVDQQILDSLVSGFLGMRDVLHRKGASCTPEV